MKRWILCPLVAIVILSVGIYAGYRYGYRALHGWAEGEGFRLMLSHEVSKSMKLHGEFDPPMKLDKWTLTTPHYLGTGWPGEAIGSLEAEDVKGVFDPWAVLKGVWQVKRIDIGKGRFVLREPNDAEKLHPAKKAPPWYAFIMPSRFYCEWIETPSADVEFVFGGKKGGLRNVHLAATMIARDFRYFVDGGTAVLPYMPELGVDWLVMYITREKADIEQAYLRGLNGDPARVELNARLGMRADKSIRADVKVSQLPLQFSLPPEMSDLLSGRLTGSVLWNTDISGKSSVAEGKLQLTETRLKAWPWLAELSRLHNNPDLLVYDFTDATCNFHYENDRFEVTDLSLNALGKLRARGRAAYDWKSKHGELDVDIDDIPIAAWLPEEFKPRVEADLRGHVKWKGSVKQLEDSKAEGNLILDDTEIRNPVRLRKILGTHSLRVPDYIRFEKARLDFTYAEQLLFVHHIQLESNDLVDFHGSATWTHQNYLQLNLAFDFKRINAWLPQKLERHLTGDLSGRVDWSCENGKMVLGNGSGYLQLKDSALTDFKLQQTLCRFLKTEDYRKLPLTQARVDWTQYQSNFSLRTIDILSPGKLGVRGNVTIARDEKLSGVVKVGLPASSLTWLPEAQTAVFTEKRDGLHWATIKLSGTLKKPQHDFTSQIMRVLERHPIALLELAMRGLSWWLGDALGTYEPPS